MDIRNVIIIGSGPAGFTAAIYLARADLNPLIFAGPSWGGQPMLTTEVENYPGFPQGILGPDLMQKFKVQAEKFGAKILDVYVNSVDFSKRPFTVVADGKRYKSKAIVIATGAEINWLGLKNEQRLIGKGVSSCAPCDAWFFKDKKVIVVGGGDTAMEEALTLAKFAKSVTIIHRRDEFRASKIMVDRVRANKKISFILNSEVVDVLGKDKVEGVRIKDKSDESEREIGVDGMFLAIGHSPATDIFKDQVDIDEKGYVRRIPEGEGPGNMQMTTSCEGVFVAGDVHDFHFRQVVTAAGFGCMAALEAEKWIEVQV